MVALPVVVALVAELTLTFISILCMYVTEMPSSSSAISVVVSVKVYVSQPTYAPDQTRHVGLRRYVRGMGSIT